ncbi:MAG: ABC-F type ribosomal protection protein [Oscillospiraceae bacterium]|nr:ABC-F type ribosomal protection protein [Oscillospiraceae bacterium]
MSLINIFNLTFAYEGSYDNIFENVSFRLDSSWKLGFTGRNGRGKTTFLKLLMGLYEYKGEISASVSFDYFPFEVKNKNLDCLEIIKAICPETEQWRIERELSLLAIQENVLLRPFETLSPGERTKLLLAALFLRENNFLLIDEPTNHLDMQSRRKVGEYLNGKKGFILVSHDRDFLDSCIDHVLSINKTNIEVQKGNFSSWQSNKTNQDNFELEENEKLKKDIKRLKKAAEQTAQWSGRVEKSKIGAVDKGYVGHMAAKMMKRSKSTEKRRDRAIEEKSGLLKNIERSDELKIHPLEYHSRRLVEFENLVISYGGREVFKPVSFRAHSGDRVLLSGRNGCGKSSIIKLLLGEDISYSGGLYIANGLVISCLPQDVSHLSGGLKDFIAQSAIDETLFKAILRKLDFSRAQFEKDMGEYSAGQKKKAALARSLSEQAHVYIWDEPLNYIDLISRIQIQELILAYRPTMLFVEHDSAFARETATAAVELRPA